MISEFCWRSVRRRIPPRPARPGIALSRPHRPVPWPLPGLRANDLAEQLEDCDGRNGDQGDHNDVFGHALATLLVRAAARRVLNVLSHAMSPSENNADSVCPARADGTIRRIRGGCGYPPRS